MRFLEQNRFKVSVEILAQRRNDTDDNDVDDNVADDDDTDDDDDDDVNRHCANNRRPGSAVFSPNRVRKTIFYEFELFRTLEICQ